MPKITMSGRKYVEGTTGDVRGAICYTGTDRNYRMF